MAERQNIQIPRTLYSKLRKAVRLASRDSRNQDRVLKDESREALVDAADALDDFQDTRVAGEEG